MFGLAGLPGLTAEGPSGLAALLGTAQVWPARPGLRSSWPLKLPLLIGRSAAQKPGCNCIQAMCESVASMLKFYGGKHRGCLSHA